MCESCHGLIQFFRFCVRPLIQTRLRETTNRLRSWSRDFLTTSGLNSSIVEATLRTLSMDGSFRGITLASFPTSHRSAHIHRRSQLRLYEDATGQLAKTWESRNDSTSYPRCIGFPGRRGEDEGIGIRDRRERGSYGKIAAHATRRNDSNEEHAHHERK